MLHLQSETCRAFPIESNMFKITVDGVEHSRYDDEWVWINVGSAAGAEVRLPWAAGEHLKIYPMDDKSSFFVRILIDLF